MTGRCCWEFNTANSDQQGKIYGHLGERQLLLVLLQTSTPFSFCCPSLIEMTRDGVLPHCSVQNPVTATALQEWQYKLIKETMYWQTFSSHSMIYVVLSPSPTGYYDFNTSCCSQSIVLQGKNTVHPCPSDFNASGTQDVYLSTSVYVIFFKNKYKQQIQCKFATQLCLHKATQSICLITWHFKINNRQKEKYDPLSSQHNTTLN